MQSANDSLYTFLYTPISCIHTSFLPEKNYDEVKKLCHYFD